MDREMAGDVRIVDIQSLQRVSSPSSTCRNPMPPETVKGAPWSTKSCPLLVLGSHAWNKVAPDGTKYVGEERQQLILRGAR